MWKKDLPIFLRPWRTSQPSWRTAAGAGPGPAEAPLGSSPLRDIPAAAGGRGSSMLLAASRLDADELSISDESSRVPAAIPLAPWTRQAAIHRWRGCSWRKRETIDVLGPANCGRAAPLPESGEGRRAEERRVPRRGKRRGGEAKEFETEVLIIILR